MSTKHSADDDTSRPIRDYDVKAFCFWLPIRKLKLLININLKKNCCKLTWFKFFWSSLLTFILRICFNGQKRFMKFNKNKQETEENGWLLVSWWSLTTTLSHGFENRRTLWNQKDRKLNKTIVFFLLLFSFKSAFKIQPTSTTKTCVNDNSR